MLTVNDQELVPEAPLPTRLDQMEELVAGAANVQGYLVEAQNVSRQLESGRRAPLEVY
ncbi:MAG: hypothetical protein WKG07_24215 [Hymenobacter sp.]